jgi:hypothetical protein
MLKVFSLALAALPALAAAGYSNTSRCIASMGVNLPYYTPEGFNFSGQIRRYYIAAEVDTWDYTPTGTLPVLKFSWLLSSM